MRRRGSLLWNGLRSFNPRICKRCDDENGDAYKVDFVSIHASVKDATKKTYNRWITTDVSIHASVKDATKIFGHI